jgi:hypothetical protein
MHRKVCEALYGLNQAMTKGGAEYSWHKKGPRTRGIRARTDQPWDGDLFHVTSEMAFMLRDRLNLLENCSMPAFDLSRLQATV